MYNNLQSKRSLDISKHFPDLCFKDNIVSEGESLHIVYRVAVSLNIFYSNTQDLPRSEISVDVVILGKYNESCISQLSQYAHMLNVCA